jgi:hypothetical protein
VYRVLVLPAPDRIPATMGRTQKRVQKGAK